MLKPAAVRLFAAALLLFAVTSAMFAAELPSAAASPDSNAAAGWSHGTLIDALQGQPTFNLLPVGEIVHRGGRQWERPHLQRQLMVVA